MMPLTFARENQAVRVLSIRGGRGIAAKLRGMGIRPGALVVPIGKTAGGPVLLMVAGSRIALGKGVAQRILVEETNE